MSVSIVSDTINEVEKYIHESTPDHIRRAMINSAPKSAIKTKSMQLIVTDDHDGNVSMLIDNMDGLATLIVNEEIVDLTAHDAVKVANFWREVAGSFS